MKLLTYITRKITHCFHKVLMLLTDNMYHTNRMLIRAATCLLTLLILTLRGDAQLPPTTPSTLSKVPLNKMFYERFNKTKFPSARSNNKAWKRIHVHPFLKLATKKGATYTECNILLGINTLTSVSYKNSFQYHNKCENICNEDGMVNRLSTCYRKAINFRQSL